MSHKSAGWRAVAVVLLVQLLPRLLKRDLKAEEARWREEQSLDRTRRRRPDLLD